MLSLKERLPDKFFFNDPIGILNAYSKHSLLDIERINPNIVPPIKRIGTKEDIVKAIKDMSQIVIKSPISNSGSGIMFLEKDTLGAIRGFHCTEAKSLDELWPKLEGDINEQGEHIAMKFFGTLKEKGDKRISIVNGQPIGSITRFPKNNSTGNVSKGAAVLAEGITHQEREIVRQLRPYFIANGLHYVGIDILHDKQGRAWVSEINVNHPMGLCDGQYYSGEPVLKRFAEGVIYASKHHNSTNKGFTNSL